MKKIRITESQLGIITGKEKIDEASMKSLKKGAKGALAGVGMLGALALAGQSDYEDAQRSQQADNETRIEIAKEQSLNRIMDENPGVDYDYVSQFYDGVSSMKELKQAEEMASYHASEHGHHNESRKRKIDSIISESINDFIKRNC